MRLCLSSLTRVLKGSPRTRPTPTTPTPCSTESGNEATAGVTLTMSKRSQQHERRGRDFYPTPFDAVLPLRPHLPETFSYSEPCAGNKDLVNHLNFLGGVCSMASDIEERDYRLDHVGDALEVDYFPGQFIITNPPWTRSILHPMIDHFRRIKPTWLLFDTDWFFTKQAAEFKPFCHKMVTVGRVKWFPDSKSVGFDNVAWYLFSRDKTTFTEAH